MQGADLVVHQGNQGRDHDGDAMAQALSGNGRYLVAQAFAAARGHEHQSVKPGHHVFDNGLLRSAELVVAEDLAENLLLRQENFAIE